jgi:hypothetical protein
MRPQYEVDVVPNVGIACDGYELAGDLCQPRDAPSAPALVTLLPGSSAVLSPLVSMLPGRLLARELSLMTREA